MDFSKIYIPFWFIAIFALLFNDKSWLIIIAYATVIRLIFGKKVVLPILSYGFTANILFGNAAKPFVFGIFLQSRLGAPYWQCVAVLGIAISLTVFIIPSRSGIYKSFKLPIFMVLLVILPTVLVGSYAEWIRAEKILEFEADQVEGHSIFRSLRQATWDGRFPMHMEVVKDCKAYYWSYAQMALIPLPQDISPDIRFENWVKRCAIQRHP